MRPTTALHFCFAKMHMNVPAAVLGEGCSLEAGDLLYQRCLGIRADRLTTVGHPCNISSLGLHRLADGCKRHPAQRLALSVGHQCLIGASVQQCRQHVTQGGFSLHTR